VILTCQVILIIFIGGGAGDEGAFSNFFEPGPTQNSIAYYKSGQRPGVAFAYGLLEDLGAGLPRHEVESFLVTLKPDSNSGENLMVHTGLKLFTAWKAN
jgi:hypothetical protein